MKVLTVPRPPHPWVYAWEERAEAARFAKELRQRTKDRS